MYARSSSTPAGNAGEPNEPRLQQRSWQRTATCSLRPASPIITGDCVITGTSAKRTFRLGLPAYRGP